MKRPLQAVAAGSLLAISASCGALARTPNPLPVTEDTVLLTVPVVPQSELHECGLATLATLCGYYGTPIPPGERTRLIELASEHKGLSGGELRSALQGMGMEAYLFRGTLDHGETGLYRHVDLGRPLLIMISADGKDAHYCLFTGYDPSTGAIYLYDPARGHLCIEGSKFKPLWENASYFTLLTVPQTKT